MATPIKAAAPLLVNRSRLSPRSPRLLLLSPFQEEVPQEWGKALSPVKLQLLSPNTCQENVNCNKSVVEISTTNRLRIPDEPLILDSPHKRDLLKDGLTKYDLLYLVGRGSFGTVIKSKYKGAVVAAKLLKLKKSTDQINEMNAGHLVHKNIIKILDVVRSEKHALVIMEYYENSKNLQQVLNESGHVLREEDLIGCSQDIARGLRYCHDNGVLHLDIKPKNILLCDNGICKICDFGNSVRECDNKQTFRFQGTVAYTAPEILRGDKPTSKCDIYSMGISMWQLVSKTNPYESLNNEVVIYKVVKFNFRPPVNFENEHLSNLCKLCWKEEPNLRPSAHEVCNMLDVIPRNV